MRQTQDGTRIRKNKQQTEGIRLREDSRQIAADLEKTDIRQGCIKTMGITGTQIGLPLFKGDSPMFDRHQKTVNNF
jgi:hypothetical protein